MAAKEVGRLSSLRNRPSCRHDGEREVLSEKATRTNRHSQVVGCPNECEMKNRRSEEIMIPATSELSVGADERCGTAWEGGGPVYNTGWSSIVSRDITWMRSLSSTHGNGLISLFNSASVGKWKSR